MTPDVEDLLAELTFLQVQIELHGDGLRFRPVEAVGDELLIRIKAHKAELVQALIYRKRIARQFAELVPIKLRDGRTTFIHPRHRAELERTGWFDKVCPVEKKKGSINGKSNHEQ